MYVITDALRNRWMIVIAAGAIMRAALGVRHVQGLFLQPVVIDQGWSREAFGFALAIQNLVWGFAQPFTGMVADRFGSAKVLFLGVLMYALGLALMASATDSTTFALTNGVLIGVALSGTAFGAVYGALSRIFGDERRAWALAIAGGLGGLGQFCMVPFAQRLLNGMSWQGAAIGLCIVMLALAPLATFLRETQVRHESNAVTGVQTSMIAAIGQAVGHRGFWLLNLGFLACGFQLAFVATHMPAYLVDHGLSVEQAGATLAIIALANVVGTYFCARLGGRWAAKHVLCGIYGLRTAAIAAFLTFPVTPASAYVFSAVMGFLWLGTVPLTNSIVAQIFGVRYISTLFGFIFLGHQFGGFLGVWLGGVAYDRYHSYDLLWLGAIGIGLVAALVHWPIDDQAITAPVLAGQSS